jgi:hypothetical protein
VPFQGRPWGRPRIAHSARPAHAEHLKAHIEELEATLETAGIAVPATRTRGRTPNGKRKTLRSPNGGAVSGAALLNRAWPFLRAKHGQVSVAQMHKARRCALGLCGRRFHPKRKNQRFCQPSCRHWARSLRRQDQRYYARRKRERELMPGRCAMCGDEIMWARRSSKRYCSTKCRQRAYRQRVPSAAQIRARLDRDLRAIDRIARATRIRRAVRQ